MGLLMIKTTLAGYFYDDYQDGIRIDTIILVWMHRREQRFSVLSQHNKTAASTLLTALIPSFCILV